MEKNSYYIYEDWEPGYNILLNEPCGKTQWLTKRGLVVPNFLDFPLPEEHELGRLPIFFRNTLPFLVPPDKLSIFENRVEVIWKGKEIVFEETFIDYTNRAYRPLDMGGYYNIPNTKVTIDLMCNDLDQFLIQIEWGNKNFIFNLIKLPYLPRLVLHPSQVKIMEGKYSTINPRFDSLNKDSYSIYSLLLLIYSWGSSCMELDIQGDSIYETNLADLSRAHIMLSLHCSRCLPQNPLPEPIDLGEGGDFVLQAAQQALIYSMVSPWIRGLPINEILIGITVVSLLQKVVPNILLRNTYAFKANEGYWVILWNEPDSLDFKGYLMITASCGDSLAHLFVRYDSPFIPSLECISFESPIALRIYSYWYTIGQTTYTRLYDYDIEEVYYEESYYEFPVNFYGIFAPGEVINQQEVDNFNEREGLFKVWTLVNPSDMTAIASQRVAMMNAEQAPYVNDYESDGWAIYTLIGLSSHPFESRLIYESVDIKSTDSLHNMRVRFDYHGGQKTLWKVFISLQDAILEQYPDADT
jgi:hypothetical protein